MHQCEMGTADMCSTTCYHLCQAVLHMPAAELLMVSHVVAVLNKS